MSTSIIKTLPPDEAQVALFLREYVPPDIEDVFVPIWCRGRRTTEFFKPSEIDLAIRYVCTRAQTDELYICNGLQANRLDGGARGGSDTVIGLPGLAVDIDVDHPGRGHHDLPKTFEDAHALIRASGLKPSAIVNTGNGLQPWYLFRETWWLPNDVERQRAKDLATRFHLHYASIAAGFGWHLDNVAALGHAFRIPGTINRKYGQQLTVRLEENYAAL